VKIGIIYQKFISSGGMEAYLFRFAREIIDSGHELQVITAQTDPATEALGANIQKVKLPGLSSTLALIKFERETRRLAGHLPVDVTIGFGRTTQHDLHRAGAGCHAAYIPLLNPFKRRGIKCQLELKLERALYTSGRTGHFIVNSAMVRDQIIDHYCINPEKVTIIHTAVDTGYFRPPDNNDASTGLRESLGTQKETPVVLFAARSHRRKGLAALIAAWPEIHSLTGAQLWIAGPRIKRFTKGLPAGLNETITLFTGLDDILHLYQAADLFVHPTLYDACANTVLQSMACGLPGIISSADGARQFIKNGSNGWLLDNPRDHLSLTELVVQAINHQDLSSIGAEARRTVLPLTWGAHLAAWKNQFERIT
jgi:UDP-glucose:(heptosyl)LPS alpha-1,3-glucosyltransferase